jgi:nitrite reductase/ring-hydroxylating ferredoxin subunit
LLDEYSYFIYSGFPYCSNVYKTHSNYVARLDAKLNEVYAYMTDCTHGQLRLKANYNTRVKKKTVLQCEFHIIYERIMGAVSKHHKRKSNSHIHWSNTHNHS